MYGGVLVDKIKVSEVQRGNPLLSHIKHVPMEFVKREEQAADFVVGPRSCALFLSVKYHMLHPQYIWGRIRQLGQAYDLRVLVCHVDIEDNVKSLGEINKICFTSDLTLILAFSEEEAARYIESLKAYQNKGSKSIQKKEEKEFVPAISKTLTGGISSVNKTDVITLLQAFNTFKGICNANEEQLLLLGGFGEKKVKDFYAATHTSFRPSNARTSTGAGGGDLARGLARSPTPTSAPASARAHVFSTTTTTAAATDATNATAAAASVPIPATAVCGAPSSSSADMT